MLFREFLDSLVQKYLLSDLNDRGISTKSERKGISLIYLGVRNTWFFKSAAYNIRVHISQFHRSGDICYLLTVFGQVWRYRFNWCGLQTAHFSPLWGAIFFFHSRIEFKSLALLILPARPKKKTLDVRSCREFDGVIALIIFHFLGRLLVEERRCYKLVVKRGSM